MIFLAVRKEHKHLHRAFFTLSDDQVCATSAGQDKERRPRRRRLHEHIFIAIALSKAKSFDKYKHYADAQIASE